MALDTHDSPSSPSRSPSHCGQPRHFYVAVDRLQFKMETLVDLLGVTGKRNGLPMVICCSSRDELDSVCSVVSNLNFISLSSLYSDLSEAERSAVSEKFRLATVRWNQRAAFHSGDGTETGEGEEEMSQMIVVTDACLPLLTSGEPPLSARVLINYELPTKKETYLRRISTCLASDGIVINMVVGGGEVVTLKSIEETSSLMIAEMPINIYEIL